jgi:L,D-transpeptidase catalytic domain
MNTLTRRHILKGGGAALATAAVAGPALALPVQDIDLLRAIADQELARNASKIRMTDRVGIADFSPNSSDPRFYIVDRVGGQITEFLVTHGRGSDPYHMGWLQNFSHVPGSLATSRGAYLTQEFYFGQHGLSMRLDGLDFDNYTARDRAIVVHGAWYAERDMIAKYGKLGRSEGCFAFAQGELPQVLSLIGPGRLLFADKLQIGGAPSHTPPVGGDNGDWDAGLPQDIWPSSTFDGTIVR